MTEINNDARLSGVGIVLSRFGDGGQTRRYDDNYRKSEREREREGAKAKERI